MSNGAPSRSNPIYEDHAFAIHLAAMKGIVDRNVLPEMEIIEVEYLANLESDGENYELQVATLDKVRQLVGGNEQLRQIVARARRPKVTIRVEHLLQRLKSTPKWSQINAVVDAHQKVTAQIGRDGDMDVALLKMIEALAGEQTWKEVVAAQLSEEVEEAARGRGLDILAQAAHQARQAARPDYTR